jgi:hypothetical protein
MRQSRGALAAMAGVAVVLGAGQVRAQDEDLPGGEEAPAEGTGIEEGGFDNYEKAEQKKKKKKKEAEYGLGLRVRGVFEPAFMMNLFVEEQTSGGVFSPGFGFELMRRRENFELVLGFEYENVSPSDGYWLEKGDDGVSAGQYPDFIDFDGLAWVTADLAFLFNSPINEKLTFRYGAGFGLGLVLGEVRQTDQVCSSTDFEESCMNAMGGQQNDEADLPPVFPVVDLILGLQYRPTPKMTIIFEGGLRTLFFFGVSVGYYFGK